MKTPLFDRNVRPLGLTPGGIVLRERATVLIADARQIAPVIKQVTKGQLSLIRVGIVSSFTRLLVPALPTFLLRYSDHVSFLSGFTASHMDDVDRRRLEIAVGVDEYDVRDGLETWPVLDEPHVVLVPADAPPVTSLEDLAKLTKTLRFSRFNTRRKIAVAIDRHLRRIGLSPPRTLEFDTPYALAASVAWGNCWAITTPLLVSETLSLIDHVRCDPLPGPGFRRRLRADRPQRRARQRASGVRRVHLHVAQGPLRSRCGAPHPVGGADHGHRVVGRDPLRGRHWEHRP